MTRDVYDKIFFKENYSAQMRERALARESANLRANATDMPNATTVVLMEDTPDGGVTITTGDFVAYFNKKHGCDRVGNMRRLLADAQRNCELKRMKEQKASEERAAQKKAAAPKQKRERRTLQPRFSFVKAVFGLMLVLAVSVLIATSALLKHTELEVATLEAEVSQMQAERGTQVKMEMRALPGDPCAYALDGEDQVEVYEAEEETPIVTELIGALSELWKS